MILDVVSFTSFYVWCAEDDIVDVFFISKRDFLLNGTNENKDDYLWIGLQF